MRNARVHLERLCRRLPASFVAGTLWFPDGECIPLGGQPPQFTIRFKTERALSATLTRFTRGFGEAYARGDIEIEGSIPAMADFGYRLANDGLKMGRLQLALFALYRLVQRHSRDADQAHVSFHYDLGNDFFSLFLDEMLTYSCAYYNSEGDSLEQAQLAKYEHVCRKLRLRPGERLIDCGSGWGGLAFYAAEQHAVQVTGYSISKNQVEYCRAEAARRGLGEERVRFVLGDYRDIPRHAMEPYDKFVSIGMVEHVGRKNLSTFAQVVTRCLRRPGGLALIHTIGTASPARMDAFAQKYIFPGAYIPTLAQVLQPFEATDPSPMHVVDVENLRDHYPLTLAAWYERFRTNRARVVEQLGEPFARIFDLYLGHGRAAFAPKDLDLFQIVLGWREPRPLTRRALYADEPP